jgi:uncharacterized protein (DUF2345 family)
MAQETRSSAEGEGRSGGLTDGIYLARVITHLDTSFMGSLEVTLLKTQANATGEDSQTYIVKYASPFFGYTPFEFMGKNDGSKSTIDGFNDTQKSYGMWMVPPDIGVNVLVLFVNGDPAQGYWFACVPGRYVNNMTPAIAGSDQYTMDPTDKARYGPLKDLTGKPLNMPVAEINKRINGTEQAGDPNKIKKVIHPIADRFLEQGLLEDDIRGVSSSSPRRELPSMVFGISTPGPLDRRNGAKKAKIGTAESQSEPVPVSRLGGTQFVMDDGDDRYHRATSASDGPVNYVDLLEGKGTGQAEIPYGEHFRIRTRTGHQLLMHNAEDLIYIGNARGTAWIELSSNGKIDIYAKDSISVHTENDFNFYADRDFNFEAGRNVNIKANGRLNGDFNQNIHLRAGLDMKVFVAESLDLKVGTKTTATIGNSLDIGVGTDTKITTLGATDIFSGSDIKLTSSTNLDINVGTSIKLGSATLDIGASGAIVMKGSRVDINGPDAAAAASATQAGTAVEAPPLSTHSNPVTNPINWPTTKYQSGAITSIMKRIPMHEPWQLHENQLPTFLTPEFTDRETSGALPAEYTAATEASQITETAAHVSEINEYAPTTGAAAATPAVTPTIATGGVQLAEDYFAPSKYSKQTATRLMTLEPAVRIVFAKCIKAFITEYFSQGWDCSVSECLRSFERSNALYAAYKAGTGPQAAPAGSSWHNYGAAADILFYKDNKWDSMNKTGVYTGFGQRFFAQNGLHNNAGANDCGHFVPLQMTKGVPKTVKSGQVKIADVMSGAVTLA